MKSKRPAFFVLETVLALALVAASLVALAQMLLLVALQKRQTNQELIAQLALGNTVERLAAMPYDELDGAALRQLENAFDLVELPGAKLNLALSSVTETPAHKRIAATLTWPARGDDRHRLELTTWRFPHNHDQHGDPNAVGEETP